MTTNVPLHQGEDAVGRPSPIISRPTTSWRQTSLLPPEQITARLDLGWDWRNHVGMFAMEAFVPATRELLALEVHPAAYYPTFHDWLGLAQRSQGLVVADLFDPEPF